MSLDEQIAAKQKELWTAQHVASYSTSDAATRVYEQRINELIKELVALERQRDGRT